MVSFLKTQTGGKMKLLTKKQLARKMGFKSTRTIDKYLGLGMPKIQVGGKNTPIRFDFTDVLNWFKKETISGDEQHE